MSDSDDTDVLLLIPPDFFNIGYSCANSVSDLHSLDSATGCGRGSYEAPNNYPENYFKMNRPYYNNPPIPTTGSSQANDFGGYSGSYQQSDESSKIYSSTPQKNLESHFSSINQTPLVRNNNFLSEIDNFLQTGNNPKNADNSIIDVQNISMNEFRSLNASDFHGLSQNIPQFNLQSSPRKFNPNMPQPTCNQVNQSRAPLMSLNEIWGTNNNGNSGSSNHLQEERLRRQHCEKNIQHLQIKVLEYEQKIAVAINLDKEKIEAINKLEESNMRLKQQLKELDSNYSNLQEKLLEENIEVKNKNLFLEKELAESMTVVKRLQDNNDVLQGKIEGLTTATNDVTEIHKNQLKDLEIRLSNSKENEKIVKEQMSAIRNMNGSLKDELEKEKEKNVEYSRLKSDFSTLKQQNETVRRKFCDSSSQNDELKKQVKDLKQQLDENIAEKKNLLKELDVQRLSLKKYYQSQVEDVVSDKLKEFQSQLNSVEEQLKDDAKRRERLIAERAIKQIELINQKNEQEIALLNEKYDEEISLYRLQLTNASKTISELEETLSGYQSRRVDIAEQLHMIMETQWQKALEILTNPSSLNPNEATSGADEALPNKSNKININRMDKDKVDGIKRNNERDDVNVIRNIAENEVFQTPISSRSNKSIPVNTLHNYIELLLKKSPRELDQLDEILMSCKKAKEPNIAGNSCSKSMSKATRPWK